MGSKTYYFSPIVLSFICYTPIVPAQTLDSAFVVARQPNFVTVIQQQCQQVQIPVHSNTPTVGGAIVGSVIGAALGSQMGRGDGRTVAAAVGAVLGSQLGSQSEQANSFAFRNVCPNVPINIQQGEIITFEYRGNRFSHQFP